MLDEHMHIQFPLSSVVERVTSNDEVSCSSQLEGIMFLPFRLTTVSV